MTWSPEWIAFIGAVVCALIAGGWGYINNRMIQKNISERVPAQNDKDRVEALKMAMEMAGMDLEEQLLLKKSVKDLEDIVKNTRIKITQTLTVSMDGGNVQADIISVEAIRVIKQQEPSVV
jgi:hypothetical protein